MNDLQLPAELEQVERALACAARPEPSTALRRRVLADLHEELRHCVLHRLRVELLRDQKRASRRLALSSAIALLLVVGLSIGTMRAVGMKLRPPTSAPSVVSVAWQLQQLSPGMSSKDSFSQAALRQIGVNGTCGDLLSNLFGDSKPEYHQRPTKGTEGGCRKKVRPLQEHSPTTSSVPLAPSPSVPQTSITNAKPHDD